MVVKKRKSTAASPATPEFQLVCTNLDELRELVKKIDGELKTMESNKKKSGKWHLRRQGVKELHGTLTRLLNELLPWEPKLLKAFQKNRARLRKDYDDFRRLPESENFTRESSSRGGCEPSKPPISVPKSAELCHKEIKKNESFDEQEHIETDICETGKVPKKECISKYLSKSQTRNSKRLFRLVDAEDQGILAQKNTKLSTPEISSTSTEGETPSNNCVSNDLQKMEVGVLEMSNESLGTSPLSVYKGPKLAEALLAKNIGNKMMLTSQLTQTISNPVPCFESTPTSPTAQQPMKSPLSCQTPLKAPMQMIYKLPDGQCVPVDLQNSSVKIQMQPVIDAKTGDRLMQQVLVLPKNIFIQQKDDRTPNVNQPLQSDVAHQNCAFNVPLSSSTADHTGSKAPPLALSKGILCSTKCSTLPVSQAPVATFASSTSMSICKTSKNSTPDYLASLMSSSYGQSLPIKSDFGRVTSSTGNPTVALQMANSSPVLQKEISEAKQELRTVCIRDSQSILVRTRGGNTGVVKVQPSQDQGTSVIHPSPMFTFTPQLQSFLVSRTKPSATSTFTPVTTSHTQPVFSSACVGRNQVSESNTNWAQVQQPAPKVTIPTVGNPMQSNFLPIVSQASTCPTNSVINTNTAAGTVTPYACYSTGQDCSVVRKAGIDLKQAEPKTSSVSVVQPDSTTPSKSDFVSGSSIHQVMLLTAPSIHPPGTSPNMGIVASPALAQVPSKKFVFINTQLPASSSANMTSLALKQATNTNIGKTYVRPPDQPQVFLIPSTMGSPIKMNSPPIVSQVKDVKIGLTIGQTIVNNTAGMKNIVPINILQNPLGKGDECIRKDSTVSTAPTFSKVHNEQVTSSNITCDYTVASTKGSVACAVVTSANTGQYSASERKGNDFLRTLSSVSSRLPTASSGSTVAISTVKTGHLSSSVLLSTNLMTEQVTHASSLLQRPISSTLPGTSLGGTPIASTYQPALMEQSENNKFISQSIHKVVSTNMTKPPATMSSSLLPTLCKTGPWHASSQALPPLSASTVNQVRPQMNESSTHHKLVINTSTPLAPGTQITINGTRFIVPPQGLGIGSHVLLLSTNAKQGPSPIGSAQACHGPPLVNTTAPQPALKQNISPTQYPVQTLKRITAPDMSTSLPNAQPASRIVNITSSDFSPFSLSSVNKPLTTTALQPLLVPCIQRGSYPQQTNMAPLSKGTPVMEAVNLNTASPPGNLLPASAMFGSKMADTESFRLQSSTADKPHTVAT